MCHNDQRLDVFYGTKPLLMCQTWTKRFWMPPQMSQDLLRRGIGNVACDVDQTIKWDNSWYNLWYNLRFCLRYNLSHNLWYSLWYTVLFVVKIVVQIAVQFMVQFMEQFMVLDTCVEASGSRATEREDRTSGAIKYSSSFIHRFEAEG